jgi:hypothetical protein
LSVRAGILHGIKKKIVLGLDGNNSFKNAEEFEISVLRPELGKKTPFWAASNAIT